MKVFIRETFAHNSRPSKFSHAFAAFRKEIGRSHAAGNEFDRPIAKANCEGFSYCSRKLLCFGILLQRTDLTGLMVQVVKDFHQCSLRLLRGYTETERGYTLIKSYHTQKSKDTVTWYAHSETRM